MSEGYEAHDPHEDAGAGGGAAFGSEGGGARSSSGGGHASRLPDELRALGRSLGRPGAEGGESMVERVLEQILAERIPTPVPVPSAEPAGRGAPLRTVRRWARARWRVLTAVLCGLVTALVLTPPVRAAVADWFGFGGVEVRYDPAAVPSPGAVVPGCGGPSLTLAQAERRAGFAPLVPDALGPPDAVTVTREPKERFLLTLCWHEHGGTIRLDEYPARLDIGFAKTVREPPEWVSLGGDEPEDAMRNPALWFARPHRLNFWLVDESGDRFTHSDRTAGPTLLWMREGATTLRLEGVAGKARAVEIARSVG